MPLLPLETLFISCLSQNKLELLDGKMRCALCFETREEAELTFEAWVSELARRKQVRPTTHKRKSRWKSAVGAYEIDLDLRRLDVRIPLHGAALFELTGTFWDAALWGGPHTSLLQHQHAWLTLSTALRADRRLNVCGRSDLILTNRTVIAPTIYAFRRGQEQWVGQRGEYLRGVPELVVEVVSASTRADDEPQGRRAAVIARAGVPRYWLVDPPNQTLVMYSLTRRGWKISRAYGPDDTLRSEFPRLQLRVAELFDEKRDMPPILVLGRAGKRAERWKVPAQPIEIDHLLLAGHPQRRYEVLDDVAPCVLAFKEKVKARRNFVHWVRQAAAIERVPVPPVIGDDCVVGRYHLRREEHRVYLDLQYPARHHRRVLESYSKPELWRSSGERK